MDYSKYIGMKVEFSKHYFGKIYKGAIVGLMSPTVFTIYSKEFGDDGKGHDQAKDFGIDCHEGSWNIEASDVFDGTKVDVEFCRLLPQIENVE